MRQLGWVLAVFCACGGGPKETPITVFDAGFGDNTPDTGESNDLGFIDLGFPDSGTDDAGFPDARPDGEVTDRGDLDGDAPDQGEEDAGPDAGFLDGFVPDAPPGDGPVPDQGFLDGGLDAGRDAGPDAGLDAGLDAGPDAGLDSGVRPPPAAYQPVDIDLTVTHGQWVQVVDIDNDGDRDILGAFSLTDTVRLYVNNGGLFTAVDLAPPGTLIAMSTTVGDFDGDGDMDVAAPGLFTRANGFNSPGSLYWFENPGVVTGTWTPRPINTGMPFWAPRTIAAGDLTGDGLADLVVGSTENYDNGNVVGHGVWWLRNTGGGFAAPQPIEAGLFTVDQVAVADIDGDQILDVLASGRGSAELNWYENARVGLNPNPSFNKYTIATFNEPSGFVLVQLDPDPTPEVVLANIGAAAIELRRLDAPQNPTQTWIPQFISANLGALPATPGDPVRLAAGDVNRDGLLDIAVASFPNELLRIYVQGNGTWLANDLVTGQPVISTGMGDLSGDGASDIVYTTYDNFAPIMDVVRWFRTVP